MEYNKITIIHTTELEEMRLSELVGQRGDIIEDLTHHSRKNKGYMILLDTPFLSQYIWFIPKNNISNG